MSTLKIHPGETQGTFLLSGDIDAETDLSPLIETADNQLTLHLRDIENIYSIGAKRWLEAIRTLRKRGVRLEYVECSEAFVEFCNLSPAFVHDIHIQSFEVSFMCEDCDEYLLQMIQMNELKVEDLPPIVPCPNCKKEMVTEEDDAFRFLSVYQG